MTPQSLLSVVYVITYNELPGMYKIGIATNMKARLAALACGVPYNPVVVCTVKSKSPTDLEKMLHTKFQDKRINREWFMLDELDISFISKLNPDVYEDVVETKKTSSPDKRPIEASKVLFASEKSPALKRMLMDGCRRISFSSDSGSISIGDIMTALELEIASASTTELINLQEELVN